MLQEMCGAMGTLGLILQTSLKVLPKDEAEVTLIIECKPQKALDKMHQWAQTSLPISANFHDGEKLFIRLSGNQTSVNAASQTIGGETQNDSASFWNDLKEQQHHFFKSEKPLWRLSLSSSTPPLNLQGDTIYEWGGALRWLSSDEPVDKIRHAAEKANGHATLFRNQHLHTEALIEPFHELSKGLFSVHRNLKQAFDPENILNPGRMYANL